MPLVPTLVLIGLRGSGKSTLGRALANELGRSFVDLDDAVAGRARLRDAGAVIREHGLPAFRAMETRALDAVLDAVPGCVLALGGGTPIAPGASDLLLEEQRQATLSIAYLRAMPATLAGRLELQPHIDRPALIAGASDPMEELTGVYAERDPIYDGIANTVVETDGLDDQLALAVLLDWARGL